MTMGELSCYLDTMRQVERDRRILENLRSRASPASPMIDGMPHGSGGRSDRVGALAVEAATVEEKIAELEAEAAKELDALEMYISSVDDERAAVAMRLHFVRGLGWSDTAELLGLWSGSGVRKLVQRYLDAHP